MADELPSKTDGAEAGSGNAMAGPIFDESDYDQAIINQVQNIEYEVAASFPLVGDKERIESLSCEYDADDVIYQAKLQDLFRRFSKIRRTRGDGNCFYRAFGFKCLEESLSDSALCKRLMSAADLTKDELVKIGYPAYTVEDFHDTFTEMLNTLSKGATLEEVTELYRNSGYSDYFVVFLRLMVSCHLQMNADFFAAFIEGGRTMKEFCSMEVEPMAKESDHIHVIALAAVVGVTVQIEYMDRGGGDHSVNHHCFPDDGSKPNMFLLYRPGHYDILYPRETDPPS